MNNNIGLPAPKKERFFFRIPISIRAKIILHGQPYKNVIIDELSTTGLSFALKEARSLPDIFKLTFRLPVSLKTMTISVEAKSRDKVLGKERFGCRFLNISDDEKQSISNYIIQLSDFSMPCIILGIATLLLSIDALWRLFAYSAIMHYSRAPFLQGFSTESLPPYYLALLCIYALACFIALFFSDDMRKKGFILNISCVVFAFIFVLTKSIIYWKVTLRESHYLVMNPYAWIQFALVIYAGMAIIVGVSYLKRVIAVSDALEAHRQTFLKKE